MRIKHNKKRNTAFVYEALIVEATIAVIKKNSERQNSAVNLIKKYFNRGNILKKDLECYRSLYENQNLKETISKRIIKEATLQKKLLDPSAVFEMQTSLIHDINKDLGPELFNNFVPNYKTLATIAQLFSDNITPKNKVILENQVITSMSNTHDATSNIKLDKVVYDVFAEKFNSKYEGTLLPEQKELLTYYVSSFTDNALTLKTFLNEEISRLKKQLTEAKKIKEIAADEQMLNKTKDIVEKLNAFSNESPNPLLFVII